MLKIAAICIASALAGVVLFAAVRPGLFDPKLYFVGEIVAQKPADPVLGWSAPVRPDPFPGEPCASVFGDSFTFSQDAKSDVEAWPAVLSRLLGCRAENYGVPGYGSDQAFLRFRQEQPRGRVVMLNHLSENVIRNVNQLRNLIAPEKRYGLKPRFLANGKLVPLSDAARLEHERWKPLGPLRSPDLLAAQVLGMTQRRPFYATFYEGEPLEVTAWVLRAFAREAEARGQTPIVGIIPTCGDLTLGISYKPLLARLAGLRVIDFGAEIARRTNEPAGLFTSCSAHPNAAGNQILAEIAAQHINSSEASRDAAGKHR